MDDALFLQELSSIGTAAGAVVAGLSAAVAAGSYRQSRQLAQEQRGYNTYADYLKVAFDNPRFSTVNTAKALADLSRDPAAYESYEWYVSRMLWAFEQVFEIVGEDPEWMVSIQGQLELHWPYLCGEFRQMNYAGDYGNPLKRMLISLEPKKSPRRPAN